MNDLSELSRRSKKDISILIPSRRSYLLTETINNLLDKTKNLHSLEIIIRIDYDDANSINNIINLPHSMVDIIIIVGGRYGGYRGTGFFFNEMASIARGEFLCLFGDDVLMHTDEWDVEVMKYTGQQVILDNGNWQFPMMNRKIYEKLGHICLGAHPDTWISHIMTEIPSIKREINIQYTHDRYEETGRNKDELYENKTGALDETRDQYVKLVKDFMELEINKLK